MNACVFLFAAAVLGGSPTSYKVDCEKGDPEACLQAGDLLFRAHDEAGAARAYQLGCDRSRPDSHLCHDVSARRSRDKAGSAELAVGADAPLRLRQLAIQCDRYDPEGCLRAAAEIDLNGPQALQQLGTLLNVGCARKDAETCATREAALAKIDEACAGGSAEDCKAAKRIREQGARLKSATADSGAPHPADKRRRPEAAEQHGGLLGLQTGLGPGGNPARWGDPVLKDAPPEPLPRPHPSSAAVDQCARMLAAISAGERKYPGDDAGRGCQAIFSSDSFRKGWNAGLRAPQDLRCTIVLEAARDSYCRPATFAKCTRASISDPREACRRLPPLLHEILVRDQGAGAATLLDASLRSAWPTLFGGK